MQKCSTWNKLNRAQRQRRASGWMAMQTTKYPGGGVGGAFLASMLRGHRPVVEQRAKVKQAERERERTGIGAWLKQVRARWAGRSKV